MSEGRSPKPPDDFDARLERARAGGRSPEREDGRSSPMTGVGLAVRIGVEMVAALAVGVGIGLLLDHWLDTSPWFMVVFFFLGAAAGILNVYRAASGIGLSPGYGEPVTSKDDDDDADAEGHQR